MPILFTPSPTALAYSANAAAIQRLISKELADTCTMCGGSGCIYCGGSGQRVRAAREDLGEMV